MNYYQVEQEEIDKLRRLKEYNRCKDKGWKEGRSWNRFNGEVVCRILIHYLEKHIPPEFKIVGPNVYVENYPVEYDLIIVEKTIKPMKFTSEYPKISCRIVIEVKKTGFYYPISEASSKIKEYKQKLENPRLPTLYITMLERTEFLAEKTSEIFGYDNAFFFTIGRKEEGWQEGEWKRFINRIKELLL